MKNILNFLIKVHKLKGVRRTGWVLRGAEDPETIAEHMFRLSLLCWFLASKQGTLNLNRVIKTALSHDLCEVFAGDVTPYSGLLPKDGRRKKDFLKRWVRLSKQRKAKRDEKKFRMEKKGLLKLIKPLPPLLKKEILTSWLDQAKNLSKVGKFVKQMDKIETMIQAIEYFGTDEDGLVVAWWEEVEELVDEPLLLGLLKIIQKKFYGFPSEKKDNRTNQELEAVLDFILRVGKLKRMPRLYWTLRGIKNPETVAGHIFTLAILSWVIGRQKKDLSQEKLLKMALCHELATAEIGDTTPYDRILSDNKSEGRKILEKMIRLSRKEKERIFFEDYTKEEKALEKITQKLNPFLRKEIIDLWQDYRKRKSPEACFLSQLNTLAILLQGLLYEKEHRHFSARPLWEWAFEVCDDPLLIDFMEELKRKFSLRNFFLNFFRHKTRR